MIGEPRIPFIQLPDFELIPQGFFGGTFPPAPFSFKPFGTLVAIGVYVASYLMIKHGKRRGLDDKKLMSFMMWCGGIGFLGGHVFDTIFYFPERIMADPLSLIRLWEGLSSFGGFAGATIGLVVWKVIHKQKALHYADVVASCFPVGWWFGRLGCSVAHDHPGIASNLWLAVRYPDGGRLDLGLIEMVLTVPLALGFLYLQRKPRPWGFYLGSMCVAYSPIRFGLDFLRIRQGVTADARYFGLTPAQWGAFLLFTAGAVVLWRALRTPLRPPDPAPSEAEPEAPEAVTPES
ncbi:MAG: prolipoprotein diacylglyceryl transferase [Myxococcales bacterium]|nr:prolipoprotein diacylglyceryl transferase [Myxococcales bacterium]